MVEIRQPGSYRYTYSADHEVVARVQPGEQVRIHCVDCFENRLVDESQHYADVCEYPFLNPQTGPVFIEGVQEGDTLLVHIDDIEITRDWAMTGLVPRFGLLTCTTATAMLTDALPEVVRKVPIRDDRVWFGELSRPLSPFVGTIGTAPKLEAINALTPSSYGGNMDCPETCAGNTLHLPVRNDGGLFFCGDGARHPGPRRDRRRRLRGAGQPGLPVRGHQGAGDRLAARHQRHASDGHRQRPPAGGRHPHRRHRADQVGGRRLRHGSHRRPDLDHAGAGAAGRQRVRTPTTRWWPRFRAPR